MFGRRTRGDLEWEITTLKYDVEFYRDHLKECNEAWKGVVKEKQELQEKHEKLKQAYVLKNNELVELKKLGEKKMTNFEYYKDEILKIGESGSTVCLWGGKLVPCNVTFPCVNCDWYCNGSNCHQKRFEWLYAEYIENPKLTKREKMFCDLVQVGWIVRDMGGKLYYYTFKPQKEQYTWGTGKPESAMCLNDFRLQLEFDFIKWEDKEPWSVQKLLDLEVEE